MSRNLTNKHNITAIILSSGYDFGRCPLASCLPTALWPVIDKPVIERLLIHLSDYGAQQTVISSGCDDAAIRNVVAVNKYNMDLKFSESGLPAGTAGCVRDAVGSDCNSLLLILPANIVNIPDIGKLVEAHYNSKCELTVVLNPADQDDNSNSQSTGIYICEPTVLAHIPAEGYYDIKESLIPAMLRAGKNVYAARLAAPVGNFRNYSEYLHAVTSHLENAGGNEFNLPVFRQNDTQTLWMSPNSQIASSAQIYGSVVIMEGACVSDGAIIFGPAVIGRNVKVGQNSLIANSILWDNSQVGSDCEVERCVVDYGAVIQSGSSLQEKPVLSHPKGILENLAKVITRDSKPQSDGKNILYWIGGGSLLAIFMWSYWFNIKDLWTIWQQSDEYSSGLLVPFLAVYILWVRRYDIWQCDIKPCLWGLLAFVSAEAIRLFGLFFMYGSAERLSIVLSITAIVLLLFGWQFFKKVSPILLFLFLMLPWPNRVQAAVSLPLQQWATSSAVFCLEMVGYEVIREGNVIHIGGTTVAVAEACNGLRMITAFFVICGLLALLIRRAWWEKLIIFASSLPIASLCNTIRLAITAVAFTILKGEYWEKMFHDFGGYAMMPLAIGIVIFEFWLLSKIVTVQTDKESVSVSK